MIKKVKISILISILSFPFSLPSFSMDIDENARNNQARRYTKEDIIAARELDLNYVKIRRQMAKMQTNFTVLNSRIGQEELTQLTAQMRSAADSRKNNIIPQMQASDLMRIWNSNSDEGIHSYYTLMLRGLEGNN